MWKWRLGWAQAMPCSTVLSGAHPRGLGWKGLLGTSGGEGGQLMVLVLMPVVSVLGQGAAHGVGTNACSCLS